MSNAFGKFGLPQNVISLQDFIDTTNNEVFTFGNPPVNIDILTSVEELNFEDAQKDSVINEAEVFL